MEDFKKYFGIARRNFVDDPLKEFGFKPYKSSYLARLTADNVLQLICFQKYRYGGQFNVEIVIRPLFCPNDNYVTLNPGNRLYCIVTKGKEDKWWANTNREETNESFQAVHTFIKKYALPFFDSTLTSKDIINAYEKNFFGKSKFGKSINWGTTGWENFDFGHIYLKSNDTRNAIKQINKCYKEFIADNREWAQDAAKKCIELKKIISAGQVEIDKYLKQTIETSKQNLNIEMW